MNVDLLGGTYTRIYIYTYNFILYMYDIVW